MIDLAVRPIVLGELLEIVEHDCEGIVPPWGFKVEVLENVNTIPGSIFRRLVRSKKYFVQLENGETCLALGLAAVAHPTIDSYCIVLVRGKKLGVHLRFLNHVVNSA